MLALNVGATCGIIIGAIIGFIITGPYILIPFFLALLVYNHSSVSHARKRKLKI